MKHYSLYVLKLEQGKYYVGITSRGVEHRYRQHVAGFAGAAWTRKYKPTKVIDTKDLGYMSFDDAQVYEDTVVNRYIKKYGVDNVRGGYISQTGIFHKLFGRYISDDNYQSLKTILVLLSIIVVLLLLYQFKT